MFSLHEKTQRRVCRTAFVVGCVLPTLCTIGWIAYHQRPWREGDWQRALQQQLHVRATVDEVRSLTPGVAQFVDVRFDDLRSEVSLGSIDSLRIAGWRSKTFTADRIEISVKEIRTLATAIATWLTTVDSPRLQLHAGIVSFVGANGEVFELTDVRLQSESQGGTLKRIVLQAGQGEPSSLIQLTIEQDSGQAEWLTAANLDTRANRLPAWLLAGVAPGLERCASAQFAGMLQIESHSQELVGSVHGRVEGVELGQWIGSAGPHRLQGTADLTLENLRWRDQRVEMAKGQLRAAAGAISGSLLLGLTEQMFCPLGERVAASKVAADEMVSFDQLACGFQIDSAGITISGMCEMGEKSVSGCLLAMGGQPVLMQPSYRDLPIGQLVRMLMLPGASWLPATREANDMADGLPLPHANGPEKRAP
ncbi:MAG: hypothetical protein KDA57_05805 [Planctomycetales bacterium]|nr:hypothetical protein [Planctomycetales bacterium]